MKRIKAFALLLGVVVLASCASQKRVIYLQDTQADEQIKIAQDYQIRIKPLRPSAARTPENMHSEITVMNDSNRDIIKRVSAVKIILEINVFFRSTGRL